MPSDEIEIQFVSNKSPLLAYAKVPLTLFNKEHLIVELKVLQGKNSPWVALPQRKEVDSWVPVVQIPEDIFQKVKQAVLLAYTAAKNSQVKKKDKEAANAAYRQEQTDSNSDISDINWTQNETLSTENLSVSEIIKLQPKPKMHLPDRNNRIKFLKSKYGKTFRGKPIKYMTNWQLYAISKSCGYR